MGQENVLVADHARAQQAVGRPWPGCVDPHVVDHPAVVDDEDAVGQNQRLVDIVGDEENSPALSLIAQPPRASGGRREAAAW